MHLVDDPVIRQIDRRDRVVYEIIVTGAARSTVETAFSDFRIDVLSDQATLRCELSNPATVFGLLDRVFEVGLELQGLRRVEERTHAADEEQGRSSCGS